MRLLLLLGLMASLGGAAAAQNFEGSFDDGSFGGAATTPPPAPPTGEAQGDDFGGSFGDGGSGAVAQPELPPPSEGGGSMPGGGDFGDGGSFEPGVVAPVTPAQPPAQQPSPSAPQLPQEPQVDPQVATFETRDFGVPPTPQLRQDQFHAPTPTSVPGAQLVTTASLAQAIQGGVAMVIIDVLGGQYTLPNAFKAPALASPGGFDDAVQQQAVQWLQQITQANPSMPIVIYCSDPNCWLSYNGVLRAVAAGYTNVYWYRGGIQAWQMAGLPLSVGGF